LRVHKTIKVRKTTCHVSRDQNLKRLEDWQTARVKKKKAVEYSLIILPSSLEQKEKKRREERETLCLQKYGEIGEESSTTSLMSHPFLTYAPEVTHHPPEYTPDTN
jgi:hypothetical protein